MSDVLAGAKLVQLVEWGYPMGSLRPVPPATKAFSVIHITGNSRLPSAEGEVAWRRNDPGLQNSATFFVNRDGSIVQALSDPLRMDPWANGDVQRPDTANPRIAAVVRDGVNANERTLVAIENVGYEPGAPITARQEDACARILAHYHRRAGVPVSRQAVVGHYQLNSVNRPNCPGVDKRVIDRIVAKAAALSTPVPDTATEDDMLDVDRYRPLASAVFKGGTIYKDPDRKASYPTPLPGPTRLEVLALPRTARLPDGRSALTPIVIDLAGGAAVDLEIGWIGFDQLDPTTWQPTAWSAPASTAETRIGAAAPHLVSAEGAQATAARELAAAKQALQG